MNGENLFFSPYFFSLIVPIIVCYSLSSQRPFEKSFHLRKMPGRAACEIIAENEC